MSASRELWPDDNSLFDVLYDKFLFWSILVGLFAFIWLLIAILRFRQGIEPSGKEEIKVGTFPKDRHNAKLEFAWFFGPTILVLWVTYLAFGSMNLVWGVMDEEMIENSFTVEVNGKQWFWEFRYQDNLTWEDISDTHDVTWAGDNLTITTSDIMAFQAIVIQDGTTYDPINLSLGSTTTSLMFDKTVENSVIIYDADGNAMHRWGHIYGHVHNHCSDGNLDFDWDENGKISQDECNYVDDSLETERIGTQWITWDPNQATKHTTDLMIPCDMDVTFNIHSEKYIQKDGENQENNIYQGVQHSFWLQEWGNKEDAVPGLDGGTWMFVQPDEEGVYPIRCAEYCGEQHSLMKGEVEVVAREVIDGVTLDPYSQTCEEDYGLVFGNFAGGD